MSKWQTPKGSKSPKAASMADGKWRFVSRLNQYTRILLFLLVIACFTSPCTSYAALKETLPVYHWSYSVLDQLRLRGYFPKLFISRRPFMRGEIARSLRTIQEDIDAGRKQPSRVEQSLLDQLNDEFNDERIALSEQLGTYRLKIGAFGTLDGLYQPKDLENSAVIHYSVNRSGKRVREKIRTKMSAGTDKLIVFHSLRFDRNLGDDPTYIGDEFLGFTAFTEQAYVQGHYGPVRFKLGRDFLVFGSGKSGHLLLSDNSRTFDMYNFDFTAAFLKFTAFGIELDDMPLDSIGVRGIGPINTARRFINGHRLDLRLGTWAHIGITELVLYGGPNRTFELAYVNPVNYYNGVTLNDADALGRPSNTLGLIDFALFPRTGVELFGELLIDDIKVEKKVLSDLEPNRIGIMVGAQYANPLGLDGVTLHTEYTRISNRTYNIFFNPWERFLHRNRPIGYFLGNNFDRFELGGSAWIMPSLFISASYKYLRQGQDNIDSPYNSDYLNIPSIDVGYAEPFPFGPVQRTHAANLSIEFLGSIDWRLQMDLRIARVNNFAFTGLNRNQIQQFRLGIFVDIDRFWDFSD